MDKNIGKKVILNIITVKGKCEYGHKKGQIYEEPFIGLCPYALHTLWPYITTKKFNGKIPWEKNNKLRVCCPNPNDLVVFEISAK